EPTPAAPKPADVPALVDSVKDALTQLDRHLQQAPTALKQQLSDAINGRALPPEQAKQAYDLAMSVLGQIDQQVNALSDADKGTFFAQFGINYAAAQAAVEKERKDGGGQGSAGNAGAKPGGAIPQDPTKNPSVGSRVDPTRQTSVLG